MKQAFMAALALGATATPVQGQTHQAPQRPTIVLVHGGFVDGSGWKGVFQRLRKNGYNVTIVQNPTTSLSDDVAATRRAIAASSGPVILVGHSYGGVVITEAGKAVAADQELLDHLRNDARPWRLTGRRGGAWRHTRGAAAPTPPAARRCALAARSRATWQVAAVGRTLDNDVHWFARPAGSLHVSSSRAGERVAGS